MELIKIKETQDGNIAFYRLDGTKVPPPRDDKALWVRQRLDWTTNSARAYVQTEPGVVGTIVNYASFTQLEEHLTNIAPNARIALIENIE